MFLQHGKPSSLTWARHTGFLSFVFCFVPVPAGVTEFQFMYGRLLTFFWYVGLRGRYSCCPANCLSSVIASQYKITVPFFYSVGQLIGDSFFFRSTSSLNSPYHTFQVDRGILPLSLCIVINFIVIKMHLIYVASYGIRWWSIWKFSSRVVSQKLIGRSNSVQPPYSGHALKFRSIYGWLWGFFLELGDNV